MLLFLHIYLYNMRRISDFITEKLKVTVKSYNITLEEFINAFKDYTVKRQLRHTVINLNDIFNVFNDFRKYPKILDYNGDYTDADVIGEPIVQLGYFFDEILNKDTLYIYYGRYGGTINFETTEELNDVFGEDVLNKIYNYLQQYEKD